MQTYDVAGLGIKKSSSEVGWGSPRRSFSRQSVVSDTVQVIFKTRNTIVL